MTSCYVFSEYVNKNEYETVGTFGGTKFQLKLCKYKCDPVGNISSKSPTCLLLYASASTIDIGLPV
jgi:hypothetical protein